MGLLRAFIAVEIPESIQKAIEKETVNLRKAADTLLVRWVPTSNIHLTLKFLGDISESNLQFIKQMLMQECSQHSPFEMQIGKLGSFPTPKRPRVIWVGIDAPAELTKIQQAIEAASSRLGYTKEDRDFSPHLTIGRVRPGLSTTDIQKIRMALESNHVTMLGSAKINALHLYKSDLQTGGSVYTRLFSAPLKSSL